MSRCATTIAVALALSTILGPGVNLLGSESHDACARQQHDCDRPARLSNCDACDQAAAAPPAGTAVESRTNLTACSHDEPVLLAGVLPGSAPRRQFAPVRTPLFDRPVLFGALLI